MHTLTRLLSILLLALPLAAQSPNKPDESQSFETLETLFQKSQDTKPDLQTRRQTARELATQATQFLTNFPASKKAAGANIFLNAALMRATLAGDTNAHTQLQTRVRQLIANPAASDDLKEHAAIVLYGTQWALKNNKTEIDEASDEGRPVYIESLFAAVDAVTNKTAILQQILLDSRSGYKLIPAQARAFAQRAHDSPAANNFIKTEAKKFLNGERSHEIGKPLDLKFTALDGREIDLAKLRGKVVLIDFWATWCGPCVGEFPKLKQTYQKFHNKGLEILAISLDENKDDLLDFLKKNGPAPWPQYYDGKLWLNEISYRFGINSVPTTWIIDKKGLLQSTNAPYDLEGLFAVEQYLEDK